MTKHDLTQRQLEALRTVRRRCQKDMLRTNDPEWKAREMELVAILDSEIAKAEATLGAAREM
ncbi:MAG TPA: hypothetical protein VEZ14_08035 [Dehalococcoidia bacterium]|nr:hypothetical protein [Dehalococcoidia bacterium]